MSVLWTKLESEIKLYASCHNNQSLEETLNWQELKNVRGLQVMASIILIAQYQVSLCNMTRDCPKGCPIRQLAAMHTEAQLSVLRRIFPK